MPRGIESEPTGENRPTRCPTCERPLESISDYPLIEIKDLIVSRIPNFVRDMPNEDNIAGKIKGFAKCEEVKDYLKRLSASKKSLIKISDIKPDLPPYHDDEAGGYYKLGGIYYLHLKDSGIPNVARVSVFSHIHQWREWRFLEIAKLAEIKYEGVLNSPDSILHGMI
jgi:hypothetical protein